MQKISTMTETQENHKGNLSAIPNKTGIITNKIDKQKSKSILFNIA